MYTMISPSPIVFFLFVESTISGKKKAKKNNFLLYIILYMHHCRNVMKYNIWVFTSWD